jgi:O-antigen/teichoic acid export membrane protein
MRLIGNFEKEATFMFVATTLSNISGYLFYVYMLRHLTAVDFGILYAMLALLAIVFVPALAIQTVIAKYTSHFKVHNQYGKIRFLFLHSLKRISLYGGIGFLIFLVFSDHIARFEQLPSRLPVVIVGFILLFSVISPTLRGIIQGLQRFGYLGWSMILDMFLRLIFGIMLVMVGYGVNGALSASIIGIFFALLVSFWPLRSLSAPKTPEKIDFREIYRYSAPVIGALACFFVLTNIDVILVKHFFSPLEAGNYSAVALVGKIIIFLPMAIAIVMFPKTSELYAQKKDAFPILKRSLLYVGLLAGGATLICLRFPSFPLWLLAGNRFQASIPLVGRFALAMTFFGLVDVLFFYQLSVHRFKFLYFAAAAAFLQIVAITIYHNSLSQVVWIVMANAVLLFLVNQFLVWMSERRGIQALSV